MKRRRSLALLGSILLGCGAQSGESDDAGAAWSESRFDAGSADAGLRPEAAPMTDASEVDPGSHDVTAADVAVLDANIADSGSDALLMLDATDSTAPDAGCAEGAPCDDGNACTTNDVCQGGICVGKPIACPASDACHASGTCDPISGLCSDPAKPNGAPCDDGNACSQSDTCQQGVCTGANWTVCSASDVCHAAGTCDPASGACSNPTGPNGTPCASTDICKVNMTCIAGVCGGGIDESACPLPFCSLPQNGCATWQDTDGDSLSDAWERNGYVDVNCNGVYDGPEIDIPLPNADPNVPDVYVKYDYMVATGAGAHSHAPPAAALDQVTQAFAAHGVKLHFVAPLAGIPEHVVTALDPAPTAACAGSDFVTMKSLRASSFGNRAPAYHYMVFAHRVTCPGIAECIACPADPLTGNKPDPNASGAADLPGDDAIVSLGDLLDGGGPLGIELWAGTIMHELGHNFGLRHGGDDNQNWKPNYMSVMNYAYQRNGIPLASTPGSTDLIPCGSDPDCGPPTIATGTCSVPGACHCTDDLAAAGFGTEICYHVDYSSRSLLDLNELAIADVSGLDESVGVGGPASDDEVVLYYVPGPAQFLGPSNGSAIDWNNDVTIQSHVTADINNDGYYSLLRTRSDWAKTGASFDHMNFRFQCTPSYSSHGTAAHRATDEMTRDWARSHRLRRRMPEAPRPGRPLPICPTAPNHCW